MSIDWACNRSRQSIDWSPEKGAKYCHCLWGLSCIVTGLPPAHFGTATPPHHAHPLLIMKQDIAILGSKMKSHIFPTGNFCQQMIRTWWHYSGPGTGPPACCIGWENPFLVGQWNVFFFAAFGSCYPFLPKWLVFANFKFNRIPPSCLPWLL